MLWVEALESDEFQQGKHVLHRQTPDGDKYCCLGVACAVALRNGLAGEVKVEHCGSDVFYDGGKVRLPPTIMDWFGLPQTDPILTSSLGSKIRASEINDRLNLPFREIAQIIRLDFELPVESSVK